MANPEDDSIERRPIESRNTGWARAVTGWLVRTGVSPNTISLLGMFAAMVAGWLFSLTSDISGWPNRALWLLGGLLCQVRLLCNLFDGMVAVERKIASARGELYNEVPDRISDAAVFIGLGFAASGDVVLGYLAALTSVFVAYVRAMAKSIGAPNDFCGPMAKPQRMALVTILAIYMGVVAGLLSWPWGEARLILAIVIAGNVLTAVRRLFRAAKHLEGPIA